MPRHVFLHVGDTHLQHGHVRNADRLAALDQIVAAGEAEPRLAAWLWPGDLFHTRSTPDDRNAVAARLQRMAARAPVVITTGNHETDAELEIFAKLAAPWPIHVVTRPETIAVQTATGATAAIFCLPYPHKAGLVSAGAATDAIGQEARHALEAIFIEHAAKLTDADANGALALMIGHVTVGGSLASTGQPQIGREIELDPALLARFDGFYVGLNHIHRHQALHGAVYAGSICRMDYGEMDPKGYVRVEITDTDCRWEFVPIAVTAQHHVEGRLTREAFVITELNGAPVHSPDGDLVIVPEEFDGADVRVRYEFVKSEIGALDVAKIHATFATARSLQLEGQPVLEHQVRAPEIAAAATLSEKVERYADAHGLPVTESLREKIDRLQQASRDEILADVTAVVSTAVAAERPTEPAVAV